MAEFTDREHYLPIRKADLIDLLCKSESMAAGAPLPAPQQDQFRRFCTILAAYYHYDYLRQLDALKDSYSPFDPDRDTKTFAELSETDRAKRLESITALEQLRDSLDSADDSHGEVGF